MPAPVATDPATAESCRNCGAGFGPIRPRFCPACGQETNLKPPTLMEFAQQFGGAYLSTEGALWRTLKLLVGKPGELTRQYLAGRRKHHVLPLRRYLTISVVTLLMLRLLASTASTTTAIANADGFDPRSAQIAVSIGPGAVAIAVAAPAPHLACGALGLAMLAIVIWSLVT